MKKIRETNKIWKKIILNMFLGFSGMILSVSLKERDTTTYTIIFSHITDTQNCTAT